ncbi:MAG: hypothetical protein NTY20_05785 [Candidatus Aenigmarchaeota archaeon]|nr:hypothetical protein [Candidatus Aenigmarchaeota archaeon]
MNDKFRKKLQREIIAENFRMSSDMNFKTIYHCLIPGMKKETRYNEQECLDLIKSKPEIVEQSIGKYLDKKQGAYVYEGKRYRKDDIIKAIFDSNNAPKNLNKINLFGES